MKGSRSRRWSGKTKIRKRPKQTKRISLPFGSVILTLGLGVPVFTDCTDGDLSTNTSTSLGVDQVMIYLFWRLKNNRLRRCTSNVREWSCIGNIGLVRAGVSPACGLDLKADWVGLANTCSYSTPNVWSRLTKESMPLLLSPCWQSPIFSNANYFFQSYR